MWDDCGMGVPHFPCYTDSSYVLFLNLLCVFTKQGNPPNMNADCNRREIELTWVINSLIIFKLYQICLIGLPAELLQVQAW